MKIKFLVDYLGRETAMKQYHKGDVDELNFAQASELVRLGVAEEVVAYIPEPRRTRKAKEELDEQDT